MRKEKSPRELKTVMETVGGISILFTAVFSAAWIAVGGASATIHEFNQAFEKALSANVTSGEYNNPYADESDGFWSAQILGNMFQGVFGGICCGFAMVGGKKVMTAETGHELCKAFSWLFLGVGLTIPFYLGSIAVGFPAIHETGGFRGYETAWCAAWPKASGCPVEYSEFNRLDWQPSLGVDTAVMMGFLAGGIGLVLGGMESVVTKKGLIGGRLSSCGSNFWKGMKGIFCCGKRPSKNPDLEVALIEVFPSRLGID